jgi:hypothetical protein
MAYAQECALAGVPLPDPFNFDDAEAEIGPWQYVGELTDSEEFVAVDKTASVFYLPSEDGVCMALPRQDTTNLNGAIVALGVICQGNRTSKACFWDAGGPGLNSLIQTSETVCLEGCDEDFEGGMDLVGRIGGVCTDCHAGENAFINHPQSLINIGAEWMQSDNWVDPIVPAPWPENVGPANYYFQERHPGATGASCGGCHTGQIVPITRFDQSIVATQAGRFPELSVVTDRYCGVTDPNNILLQASNKTMPPLGISSMDKEVGLSDMVDACFLPEGASRIARAIYYHALERPPTRTDGWAVADLVTAGRAYGDIQDFYFRPYLQTFPSSSTLVIDGEEDAVWSGTAPPQPVDTVIEGERAPRLHPVNSNVSDLSATWRALWDRDFLYVLVQVEDDNGPVWNSSNVWQDDSVELYIDARDDKVNGYYDENDFQFIFRAAQPGIVHPGGKRPGQNMDGIVYDQSTSAEGWSVEAAIPWTTLGIAPGGRIGLEVHVNDDDDDGDGITDRDAQVSWRTLETDTWENPSNTTSVDLATLLSPRTFSTSVTVDGDDQEMDWQTVLQYELERTPSPIAPSNNSATWSAFWDADNLYFFIRVIDDFVAPHDGPQHYHDDSVEIFIDANNSHASAFDDHDDFQILIKPGELDTVYLGDRSVVQPTDAIQSASTEILGGGYNLEVAIPWAWLKTSPAKGLRLGLEVQVNDDDDTYVREGKLSWCSDTNDTYFDPSYFCVAKLAGVDDDTPTIRRVARNNRRFEPSIVDPESFGSDYLLSFDGAVDDELWTETLQSEAYPIAQSIRDNPTAQGEWRAAWNEDYLYFQISVFDDGPPVSDSPDWWNDDSVEIYIDANHSRGENYGSQTYQYIFKPGTEFMDMVYPGDQSSDAPVDGIEVLSTVGTDGYDMEVAIPWVTLGMLPETSAQFGLEVQLNDDDLLEDQDHTREGKKAWFASPLLGDVAWYRADAMATVRLVE